MKSVTSISKESAAIGVIFKLSLDCGHVKTYSPLDDKRDYARAESLTRAKCKVCESAISDTKTCGSCGEAKGRDEFFSARGCSDGLQKRCKQCQKQYIATLNDGTKYISRAALEHKARYPKKAKAREMLCNAVSRGIISRPQHCEDCGCAADLHGHHDDYCKPLDVRWLCRGCHVDWHRIYGPGKNGA